MNIYEKDLVIRLVYLWTRDACMPVNKETKAYVLGNLSTLDKKAIYSDRGRESLAKEVAETPLPTSWIETWGES